MPNVFEHKNPNPAGKANDPKQEHAQHESKSAPNDKVRTSTGQPEQMAAPVPLNQILTSNQIMLLNRSHAAIKVIG